MIDENSSQPNHCGSLAASVQWRQSANCVTVFLLTDQTIYTLVWTLNTSLSPTIMQWHLNQWHLWLSIHHRIKQTYCTQSDHLSGKPGNVREFDSCQGNVRDFTKSRGKILSGKSGLKLFIVCWVCAFDFGLLHDMSNTQHCLHSGHSHCRWCQTAACCTVMVYTLHSNGIHVVRFNVPLDAV